MAKENIIDVKNLVKKYSKSETNAVDDISFYVEKNSFFAFLGPNGAGKTTTLSILNTTLSMTSGYVQIAGYDLNTQAEKVRQNIGVIFQNPSLDINLTAEENVRFHANLYGMYDYRPTFKLMPQHYKDRVIQLTEVLGMTEKDIFMPVKKLSGGMKRKLEIIRGLMHNPKVLFLDEPTTGLDPVSRKNLWNYLKTIRNETDVTIFLTTHYLEEAEGADYIVVIDKGKIVSKGTASQIKESLINNYIEIDAKDRVKLKQELSEKSINFEGAGPFRLYIEGNKVHHIIKSIDTELSTVLVHAPSLEEAYINIIEGKSSEK